MFVLLLKSLPGGEFCHENKICMDASQENSWTSLEGLVCISHPPFRTVLKRIGRLLFRLVWKTVRLAGPRRGQIRPSDFSSDLVTRGSALLGIVAASAKREAFNLEACRDTSLNGVLGVECSNHSVPTILFNDLGQCLPHWPFSCA